MNGSNRDQFGTRPLAFKLCLNSVTQSCSALYVVVTETFFYLNSKMHNSLTYSIKK
jgi:hypothetical protein